MNRSTDGFDTQFTFDTSSSEVYRILSTVRNKILEWALLLEEHEIVGEGMTFTDEEKKKAQNTQIINNYTNNFYSEVSDIEMKQGEQKYNYSSKGCFEFLHLLTSSIMTWQR